MSVFRSLIVFIAICFACSIYAVDLKFKHFGAKNGLNSDIVQVVFEDSHGFIWIGTKDGLNRFDGSSFNQYDFLNIDESSKGGSFVTGIAEDKEGWLWISTLNGLIRLNPKTNSFTRFLTDSTINNSISHNVIADVEIDIHGNIWVSTRTGLDKFDFANGGFIHYLPDSINTSSLLKGEPRSLYCDSQGRVWVILRRSGVSVLNTSNASLENYTELPNGDKLNVSVVGELPNGTILFATVDQGIFTFDIEARSLHRTNYVQKTGGAFPEVSSMQLDANGLLWIGSNDKGITIHDLSTSSSKTLSKGDPKLGLLTSMCVVGLMRDSYNNMWIATHTGGVLQYSPLSLRVEHYEKNQIGNSLSGDNVNCFLEDREGNLWVGTDGDGLCKLNSSGEFEVFGIEHGLSSLSILDIELVGDKLYLATWNGGLNVFDPKLKTATYLKFDNSFNGPKGNHIISLLKIQDKPEILVSSFGKGLLKFNLESNQFEKYLPFQYPNSGLIYKSFIDSYGDVWILTPERLHRFSNGKLYGYDHDDDSASIVSNTVNDIFEDSNKRLWIATSDGFDLYDRLHNSFIHVQDSQGNLTDLKSIVEAENGLLWIAGGNSLFKFNPNTKSFINMSKRYGVPNILYSNRAAFKLSDGSLVFGSNEGFVRFNTSQLSDLNIIPVVYIARLMINSKSIENFPNLEKIAPEFMEEIELPYEQNNLLFDLGCINSIDPQKNRFRYRLENFENGWNYTENPKEIQYTNLPAGVYRFFVCATTSEGEWAPVKSLVTIVIRKPWWQSWWFRISILLFLAICIVFVIRYREREIKNKNEKLQMAVNERTEELFAAMKEMELQKEYIEERNKILKEQGEEITSKNEELNETLELKDNLISLISHDFRNPINALVGQSELLVENFDKMNEDEKRSLANAIASASDSLMRNFLRFMDWVGAKKELISCSPESFDLPVVINETLRFLQSEYLKKNIEVSFNFSLQRQVYADSRMIRVVLRNILSNSIKFTENGGRILISAKELNGKIHMSVEDNGVGIDKDRLNSFDSGVDLESTIGTNNEVGTGLGLKTCKDFIEKNSGEFNVISELGSGTEVVVVLPAGEELSFVKEDFMAKEDIPNVFVSNSLKLMLIVDDDENIVNYLRHYFHAEFKVEIASNGKEGIEKAVDLVPDIVLSDIRMPEISGLELCHILKNNPLTNHIPVMLLTGENVNDMRLEGLRLGAHDYITKPFNISILKSKINSLLYNRELYRKYLKQEFLSSPNELEYDGVDDRFLKEVTDLLEANLNSEDFTVESLGKKLGYSRSQFFRKFKAIIGQSPIEFINSYRMKKAVILLKAGHLRVSEIAYEVGFSDAKYFSKCFTKEFGVSPSKYIKSLK